MRRNARAFPRDRQGRGVAAVVERECVRVRKLVFVRFQYEKVFSTNPSKVLRATTNFQLFLSLWLTQLTYSTKKNQRCPRVYCSYVRNMPIRGEILKNPSLEQFRTPNTAKSYEANLNRYFFTNFIEIKVKKILWKKNLEIVANFGICKIVPKIAKCIDLSKNMKKIRAWQICNFWKFAK